MSLLEDMFLENEAGEAQELERIIEGDDYGERPRTFSDSDDNSAKEDEAEEDKKRVDPTSAKSKRVTKNPRFVLNPARLTGPRGIQVIPEHFKDFKFKGKGHETEDLDLVLKKLEHWAYRLYPKFQFEDCLKKIETLGKKRPVSVHLHKIRMDMITTEETVVQKDSSDDETTPVQAPEEDEFDKLLQQQIEIARATPAPGSVKKTPFNDRPSIMPKATSSPSINDEQRERMLSNRRMAEERRLARLKQNTSQVKPVQNGSTESPTVIDKILPQRKNNKSVIDSSDDENVTTLSHIKLTYDIILNSNESDTVEPHIDDLVVANSSQCNIPAKKHKMDSDIIRDSSANIQLNNKENLVELDKDDTVVTQSSNIYMIPTTENLANTVDTNVYNNIIDQDKNHDVNDTKSSKHQDTILNESILIDNVTNKTHSRSNSIGSSDSEDELVVMNESITVDVHNTNGHSSSKFKNSGNNKIMNLSDDLKSKSSVDN